MDKAKIVKIGTIDEEGFPKGWVFDLQGKGAAISIPVPGAFDLRDMRASVIADGYGYGVDVDYMPPVYVLYGGYTVAELREIVSAGAQ